MSRLGIAVVAKTIDREMKKEQAKKEKKKGSFKKK